MKKLVLPIAIVLMMLLIGIAYTWDSVRSANASRHRVDLAEQEVQKQEQRLVKVLAENPKSSAEVQSALVAYKAADNPQARHAAYEQLVSNFKASMSTQLDATNPLERGVMDNVTGAINRHEVAQKVYDQESSAYQSFLSGFGGSLARAFSSSARADWKTAEKP